MSDRVGRRQPLTRAREATALASALIAAVAFAVPTAMLIASTGAVMLTMAGPGLALSGDAILTDGGDTGGVNKWGESREPSLS